MRNKMIEKKTINDINFSNIPNKYAKYLSAGFDTVQESFDVSVKGNFSDLFLALKNKAENDKAPVTLSFFSDLQMQPFGASGFKYVISNDDYQVLIRNPEGEVTDWQVTIRYLAAGLWEHGYNNLKERVLEFISLVCYKPNSDEWQRVTRADYCFDFYSPNFADEMTFDILNNVVATSKTKVNAHTQLDVYGKAGKVETITIGSKKSLQVSVYDKTKEITEFSGKTWFYKIWGKKYNDSVYRVEVRMAKEWLRNRNIKSFEELIENIAELLNEALCLRRLTVKGSDSNRSRWKMHPLWCLCLESIGNPEDVLKIGRYVTERRECLEEKISKQTAGCVRSLIVLKCKNLDEESIISTLDEVKNILLLDDQNNSKISKVKERYKYIDEAR